MIIRETKKGKKWEAWEGRNVVLTLRKEQHQGRGAMWTFAERGGFDVGALSHDQAQAALELLKVAFGEV